MGWSNCGEDSKGRPIGYAHEGTCDEPGCTEKIDRGLAYACGEMHGFGPGCEGYFCAAHLFLGKFEGRVVFMCEKCADEEPWGE